MDVLLQLGIYLAIAIGIAGIAIVGIWLRRRFNIKDSEIELAKLILQVVDLIVAKGNVKYKGEISVVINYVIEGIKFVNEFEQVDSIHQQKELVAEKALSICEENGITPDQAVVELIDQVIEYFIK